MTYMTTKMPRPTRVRPVNPRLEIHALVNNAGRPLENCQKRLRITEKRIDEKDQAMEKKDELMKEHKREIRRLRKLLRDMGYDPDGNPGQRNERRKRDGGARSKTHTWQNMLRFFLAGNLDETYETVWKQSQRELNMPVNPATAHPNVRFIARDADDSLDCNSRPSFQDVPAVSRPGSELRNCFGDLPDNVVFRMLEELLWVDGSLVHCFSRLDPYSRPDHFPAAKELRNTRTGIKGRFFISEESISQLSLTHDTVDPNHILSPLSVCRKWAWYGIHIWYGRNTFAFSSLGEWDRFCNGIGEARVQRLQVSCPEIHR